MLDFAQNGTGTAGEAPVRIRSHYASPVCVSVIRRSGTDADRSAAFAGEHDLS